MGLIVDSSAIIAILEQAPEHGLFWSLLYEAPEKFISAVSYVEISSVLERRRGEAGKNAIDKLINTHHLQIHPVTVTQSIIARNAYRLYGRGSGHKANLNIGDVFSYALSKEMDAPLLFKGDDFIHTDVKRAA